MRKTILDDGFHNYLVEGASFVGAPGIPSLMNLNNIQIPKSLIPFEKSSIQLTNVNTFIFICMINFLLTF